MDSCTPIYAYCANSRCYSLAWQPNSDFGGNTSSPLVAEGKTDSYPTLAWLMFMFYCLNIVLFLFAKLKLAPVFQ